MCEFVTEHGTLTTNPSAFSCPTDFMEPIGSWQQRNNGLWLKQSHDGSKAMTT